MKVFLIIATIGYVGGTAHGTGSAVNVTPVDNIAQCMAVAERADALDRLVHRNNRGSSVPRFSAVCAQVDEDGRMAYHAIYHMGQWTK